MDAADFRRIALSLEGAEEGSHMSYLRDGMQMLKELALVRWNALTGHYSKRTESILRTGETRR